jgi:hypothetical protein
MSRLLFAVCQAISRDGSIILFSLMSFSISFIFMIFGKVFITG